MGNQNSEIFTMDKKREESQKSHHSGSKQDNQESLENDEGGGLL